MTGTAVHGYTAIFTARITGATLCCYRSEEQDPREGLTPEEAREICMEDPSMVYCYASIEHGDLADRIETLGAESSMADDDAMAAFANAALNGDAQALVSCLEALSDADAMVWDTPTCRWVMER